ncbi:MAG: hypothetical protein HZC17_01440 [Candidatus Omnitrophica bacterium]|nr:hypothetical protein [Candidatus Omnitrophota bacterium]
MITLPKKSLPLISAIFLVGCARLFGWDIHAPGLLSSNFERQILPVHERVALYLPLESLKYVSTDKGDRLADPQVYHVGEAFGPMMVEGMQNAFDEFVMIETKPTPEIMKRYQIPYLMIVRIKQFRNHVTWHGQSVSLEAETVVYDSDLKQIAQFESRGTSDAKKVFAKKGGPEVNLNAAVEENVLSIVQYLQDSVRNGVWK